MLGTYCLLCDARLKALEAILRGQIMGKAILEFDLPDESTEFKMASTAMDMWCAMWDFSQWMRSQWKYVEHEHSETMDFIDECRQQFYTCLEDHGVNLDALP